MPNLNLTDKERQQQVEYFVAQMTALKAASESADAIQAMIDKFVYFDGELNLVPIAQLPEPARLDLYVLNNDQQYRNEKGIVDRLLLVEEYVQCETDKQRDGFKKRYCSQINRILHPSRAYISHQDLLIWSSIYESLFQPEEKNQKDK